MLGETCECVRICHPSPLGVANMAFLAVTSVVKGARTMIFFK